MREVRPSGDDAFEVIAPPHLITVERYGRGGWVLTANQHVCGFYETSEEALAEAQLIEPTW